MRCESQLFSGSETNLAQASGRAQGAAISIGSAAPRASSVALPALASAAPPLIKPSPAPPSSVTTELSPWACEWRCSKAWLWTGKAASRKPAPRRKSCQPSIACVTAAAATSR